MTITTTTEALDLTAVAQWLRDRGVRIEGLLSAEVIKGGRSNLTFFISDDAGHRWVLRRPPLGSVLRSAHDVGRECRVLSALATSAVPVPAIVGEGVDALGVPFYVMQAEQHRTVPLAGADRVRDRLLAHLPVQGETTLVHGDYRLDNTILDERGELCAVLDWELATRGDPMVDLAVFLYYWTERGDAVHPFPEPATVLPGFSDRAELLRHYAALSGREPVRVDYYLAFAAWRLALVLEGVASRSAAGGYGASDALEEARLASVVRQLVAHADALLDRDRR